MRSISGIGVARVPGWLPVLLLVTRMAGSVSGEDDDWVTHRSEKYAFTMRVPGEVRFTEGPFETGWVKLEGRDDEDVFQVLVKPGARLEAKELEAAGIKLTGMAAANWTEVPAGKEKDADMGGWSWSRIVKVPDGDRAAYGRYGTGPKGSYLFMFITTKEDFEEDKAEIESWARGINLFPDP